MKISCQSCQAKYTIADEKVLGKIVKIRCKKCSATIVINGNETAMAGASAAMDATQGDPNNVFDYTAQAQGGEQWTVNVADGDQRTMSSAELADGYRQGVVNDETYCWKDGMSDWLPLREIEALYAICTMGPRPSISPDGSQHDEAATKVQESNLGSLFGAGGGGGMGQGLGGGAGAAAHMSGGGGGMGVGAPMQMAAAPASSPPPGFGSQDANGNGMGGGLYTAAGPSAARRAGGRGNQGADLFGAVAQAGGEDDVMTSAPTGMPTAHEAPGDGKLTGQRNENSVLFSLSALTNNPNGGKEEKAPPMGEGSGLIDIRALSASMEPKQERSNRVDDIMNLAGGGAFTPALAAPVLAPPAMDGVAGGYGGEGQKSNKTMFAILGGCAFIGIAIIVVAIMVLGKSDPPPVVAPTATTTTTAGGTPTGTGTGTAPSATTASTDTAAHTDPSATAAASTASATPTATVAKVPTGARTAPTVKPPTTGPATTAPVVTTPTQTGPKLGPCGCPPGDLDCAINCTGRGKKGK